MNIGIKKIFFLYKSPPKLMLRVKSLSMKTMKSYITKLKMRKLKVMRSGNSMHQTKMSMKTSMEETFRSTQKKGWDFKVSNGHCFI